VYAAKMPLDAVSSPSQALTDPTFRRALMQMVRRRVPESDAEDIVQSALAEALASRSAPPEADALRRFVWGIARHRVADYYRRARREKLDVPELAGADAPHSEEDMLRWAARELPATKDAQRTLEWMLREGEGEKLEAIAQSEDVPAPRVRQRVSRLRRHLKERWAIELAALAAIGVLVALLVWEVLRRPGAPITHEAPTAPSAEPRIMKRPAPPKSLPGDTDVPNDRRLAPPPPTAPAPAPSPLPTTSTLDVTPAPLTSARPIFQQKPVAPPVKPRAPVKDSMLDGPQSKGTSFPFDPPPYGDEPKKLESAKKK
jgi:RNA polymerase sigma factor (sigma-70 family)